MGIVLDCIVLAIVLISTFIGYKRGLVNVIFNLCAFIVALMVTIILYRPITNFVIDNTDWDNKIENIIIENGITDEKKDESKENSNTLNEYIDKYVKRSVYDTKNSVIKSSATIISEKIIGIIVWIALFIIIRIISIFAKFLVNEIADLPIIKQCNELGGLLYGLLIGVFIVYAVLAILFFVVSVNNTGIISNSIDESYITKVLYGNNFILNLIF